MTTKELFKLFSEAYAVCIEGYSTPVIHTVSHYPVGEYLENEELVRLDESCMIFCESDVQQIVANKYTVEVKFAENDAFYTFSFLNRKQILPHGKQGEEND